MQEPKTVTAGDEDRPLREDIRLLGRILGDTVREQSGAEVFDTVEYIRQNSVRFRRDEDVTARHNLETTLNNLPPQQALQIIRAFGFFRTSPISPRISTRSAISMPTLWAAMARRGRPKGRWRMPSRAPPKPAFHPRVSPVFSPRPWSCRC